MRRCLNCMNEYPEECQDTCPLCGFKDGVTQDSAVYLQPGSILQGRYIVGTVIKARDIDLVYHGWDAMFDRKVQIQEYFPKYCGTRSGKPEISVYDAKQERYQEGLELFCMQSRELIRLYKETDIVTYHACFRANNTAYAVTDCPGAKTLEEWMEGGVLPARKAHAYLRDAMEAVDKCHSIGVFHGMIGAGTFWVNGKDQLILKDFGAWRYCSGEPGIVDYGSAGVHTDVYGLANLFCQMVTGKETVEAEKLEMELLKNQAALTSTEIAAIKRALSHDTKTLDDFCREFYGKKKVGQNAALGHILANRKDARNQLSLPRWMPGAAFAALGVIILFTVLVGIGAVRMRVQSGESRLEQESVRVPNVINKDADEAEQSLRELGLVLSKTEMEFSDQIAQGRITYQNPKEGSAVDRGQTVTVQVSMGKEKAELPSVEGLKMEEAESRLREAGFQNIHTVKDEKTEGFFGGVLRVELQEGGEKEQEPAKTNVLYRIFGRNERKKQDSGMIALDTEITLVICAKETAETGSQVMVPAVTGMQKREAEKRMAQAGFKINWTEEAGNEPPGIVVGQLPEAEAEAAKGSYVTVRVSKGPAKRYMKNLELMNEAEARDEAESLELTVEIEKRYSESVAAGKVIEQSIEPDTEIKKGGMLKLVVSLGSKPDETKKTEPDTKPTSSTKPVSSTKSTSSTKPASVTKPETTAAEQATTAASPTEEQTDKAKVETGVAPTMPPPYTGEDTWAQEPPASGETNAPLNKVIPSEESSRSPVIDAGGEQAQ